MNYERRKQIENLANGILQCNVLNSAPISLICDIMKRRNIKFKELLEEDENFCGIYIEKANGNKFIFVNSNMYQPRKNFTIAHELGHHFLGHTLTDGAIICSKSDLDSKNKERPEIEKEADYFATCFLMPKNLLIKKKHDVSKSYGNQLELFQNTDEKANHEQLIKYLSDDFKVSKEAMGYRLKELKIL